MTDIRTPESAPTQEVAIRRAMERGLGIEDIAAQSAGWACGPIPENQVRWLVEGWRGTGQLTSIVRARTGGRRNAG